MQKIKHFSILATCLLTMNFISSCSSNDIVDDLDSNQEANKPHTCELNLNITKTDYSDSPKSRSASGWENGDKIYLTFTVSDGTTYGDAVYNDGTWTVNYYGTLTEGASTKCSAVYFENADFESSSVVKLNENTSIYEDLNGQYIYSGGSLSVTANLSPKVGRIRFAGTDNEQITVYGISHFTSYDCSNGKYTSSIGALKKTVTSGYTPYIYGEFADSGQPRLNVITKDSGFTRLLSTTIYQKGESGYMTIPTESDHNGWQNSVIFKVNGVEFTMIPVTYSSGNFLLAETETTEQLYSAINGSSTTSTLPQSSLSWSSWSNFISRISAITELDFRMPTVSEWQYAAKGGEKSQGYTYAGSNIISNVAWYSGNASSKQGVKQLQPNELGFYDMSGNVEEATATAYSSRYYYFCGGSYYQSESYCKITSKNNYYDTNDYKYLGLRLALSNN